MTNLFKKIKYVALISALLISNSALAVNVTVPSAPKAGYALVSTSTGAYIATTTAPFFIGGLYASSTTLGNYIFGNLFLPSLSQGLLYNGTNGLTRTVATTSASCSGTVSCSQFTVLGSAPITITGSGGSGSGTVSTSTNEIAGRLAYWTSNSATPALLGMIATSTPTVTAPITYSGTLGSFVGGIAGTFDCTSASAGVKGCVTATDWSKFNSATTTFSTGLTYTGATNAVTVNTSQNISTLSNLTSNGIVYTAGGAGTLNTVATSSLTGTGLISVTAGAYVLGATPIVVSCPTCGAGTVTGVTGTWPIISSGGATPAISYAGFGTTSDTGIGNNLILYTNNAGIIKGVASSSLSLPNTALQNSTIGLTSSGSVTVGTSPISLGGSSTLNLNMGNANTWTALQTFGNSTTTYGSFLTSSSTDAYFGTGQGIATIGSLGRLRAVATSSFALSQFTNDLSNLTALDTSLTFSGSYNGSAARTVGLNTGRTNTWSVLQNFNYSSSTVYSSFQTASSTFYHGAGLASCNGASNALTWSAGVFGCNTITGGTGNMSGWATSTISSQLVLYPVDSATTDVIFGRSATTSAPFWWDVSATSTYIGNGGVGTSSMSFSGGTGTNKFWNIGSYSTSQSGFGNFYIASSSSDQDMVTNQYFTITQSGNVGISSSSPFAKLSVVGGGTETNPSFIVATTSDWLSNGAVAPLLFANATTSNKIVQSITGRIAEMGVRIGVGVSNYLGFGGLLDQFVVRGRSNDVDWLDVDCDGSAAQGIAALAADGFTGCDGFTFAEDGTGTLTATALTGGGATFSRLAAAANNDGAGVFVSGASAGWLTLASSTPVMEVNLRIRNSTATTSQYYIGFTNTAQAGTSYEVEPTQGCYLTASSTTANWRAICRTAAGAGNMTMIDTGIASSTIVASNGGFRKFRIEADSTKAEFYIQNDEGSNLIKVATITTTYPATTLLNAGVHYGLVSINANSGFDFFRTRFWWRDNLPKL